MIINLLIIFQSFLVLLRIAQYLCFYNDSNYQYHYPDHNPRKHIIVFVRCFLDYSYRYGVGVVIVEGVGTQAVTIFCCQAVNEYCVAFGFGGGIAVYHHAVVLYTRCRQCVVFLCRFYTRLIVMPLLAIDVFS